MELRPAAAADLPALAEGLARLPLLVRYGRTATRWPPISRRRTGAATGSSLAVEPPARPAWPGSSAQGTFGMGAYLRLMAVLPEAQARGVGGGAPGRLRGRGGRGVGPRLPALLGLQRAGAALLRAPRLAAHRARCPGLVLPGVDELVYWKRLR